MTTPPVRPAPGRTAHLAALALLGLATLGAVASGAQELSDSATALGGWLGERLPERGTVHAVYESSRSLNRALFGYDVETASWYGCYVGKVSGRDADGRLYRNAKPYGSVEWYTDHPSGVSDRVVDGAFPSVILYDIKSRPAEAADITRTNDGGWVVGFDFPMGAREYREGWFEGSYRPPDRRITYLVGADGRLAGIDHGTGPLDIVYAEVGAAIPVAAHFGSDGDWRFIEFADTAPDVAAAFSRDEVVLRAEAAGILTAPVVRWRPEDGPVTDGADPRGPAPVLPDRPARRWISVPIVGAGVAFVAIGIMAWLRRR